MIRTFEIRLNAAHPELPIAEGAAFVGSPSTAFIRGVPRSVGDWKITKVYVAVTYPDASTYSIEAVTGADGVYVATIPGTMQSGRVANGLQVLADGVSERGNPVTGYVLGIGDMAIYTREMHIEPSGDPAWILHYFDAAPTVAKKGDVAPVGGVLKLYTGTAWVPFADLTNYYTKTETDEAIDRLAAYYITYNAAGAAFPTRADLVNAQTYYSGGVARVPTRNDYAVVLADESHSGAEWRYIYAVADGATTGQWEAQYPIETNDYSQLGNKPTINSVELSGNKTSAQLGLASVADVTLTPVYGGNGEKYSAWVCSPSTHDGKALSVEWDSSVRTWRLAEDGEWVSYVMGSQNPDSLEENFYVWELVTATRTENPLIGYVLGSQTNKKLATAEQGARADAALPKSGGTKSGAVNMGLNGIRFGDWILIGGNAGEIYFQYALGAGLIEFPPNSGTNHYDVVSYRSDLPYALGTAITTGNRNLSDRTINAVNLGANNITLSFPTKKTGLARDFLIFVSKASDATGTLTISAPTGATIYGDSLTQTMAAGEKWVLGVTEIAEDVFDVRAEKMEVAP